MKVTNVVDHIGFLSYSRRDSKIMEQVKKALDNAGLTVWVDSRIEAGSESWMIDIENALRSSKFIIVLLSPDAKKSKWVVCEITVADWLNLPIFPILVHGNRLDSVPLGLVTSNWIDLQLTESTEVDDNSRFLHLEQYFNEQIEKLIQGIRNSLLIRNDIIFIDSEPDPELQFSSDISNQGLLVNKALQSGEAQSLDINTDVSVDSVTDYNISMHSMENGQIVGIEKNISPNPLTNVTVLPVEPKDKILTTPQSETLSIDLPPSEKNIVLPSDKSNHGKKVNLKQGETLNWIAIIISLLLSIVDISNLPFPDNIIGRHVSIWALVIPTVVTIIPLLGYASSNRFRDWMRKPRLLPWVLAGLLALILMTLNHLPIIQLRLLFPVYPRAFPSANAPRVSGIPELKAYDIYNVLGISEDHEWYLIECPAKPDENVGCWIPGGDQVETFANRGLISEITITPTSSPAKTYTPSRDDVIVRIGPGENFVPLTTDGDVALKLDAYDAYDLIGISKDGRWYYIGLPSGGSGWVTSSTTYGKINAPILELSVIDQSSISSVATAGATAFTPDTVTESSNVETPTSENEATQLPTFTEVFPTNTTAPIITTTIISEGLPTDEATPLQTIEATCPEAPEGMVFISQGDCSGFFIDIELITKAAFAQFRNTYEITADDQWWTAAGKIWKVGIPLQPIPPDQQNAEPAKVRGFEAHAYCRWRLQEQNAQLPFLTEWQLAQTRIEQTTYEEWALHPTSNITNETYVYQYIGGNNPSSDPVDPGRGEAYFRCILPV